MAELVFQREAAAEYDRAFAHVTRYFMSFVLRAAHIAPGMRILDIATGGAWCRWLGRARHCSGYLA